MEPATTRFFAMPELVAHLTNYLHHPGITSLMQTSRRIHDLCIPAQYRSIQLGRFFYDLTTNATQSVAKNVHRVRHVLLFRHGITYYTNGVIAFLDLLATQQAITTTISRQPALSRPVWLAPPDPHICKVVPIPPMALLTKLEFYFGEQGEFEECPYYLASYKDPKSILTKICWIIESNPHLLDLQLNGFIIKDRRDARLLTRSVTGLQRLQNLQVFFYQWEEWAGPWMSQVAIDLVFACPPTLRACKVGSSELDESDIDVFTDEYIQLSPGTLQSWEKSDVECGLTSTTPRRQEPLLQLKSLSLGALDEGTTEEDIRSLFQHCPNITTLTMPPIPSDINDIQRLGQEIAQYCPKLSDLSFRAFGMGSDVAGELLVWILEALPQQQVTSLYCSDHLPPFTALGLGGSSDAGSIFRRHSSTLRTITVSGCQNIDSKAIQTILVGCEALEDFAITWETGSEQQSLCLHLEDAIEIPWACTRIQRLDLWIAIPDEPLHRLAEGVVPYYNRPLPTTLSKEETAQFRMLESFYQQIGMLTELQFLNLSALFFDPRENGRRFSYELFDSTFPGLLSLGSRETGRLGYLHLLGGLTKLRSLDGSVSATTEEGKAALGMGEVIWMEQHWPALEYARFFDVDDLGDVTFRRQHCELGVDIQDSGGTAEAAGSEISLPRTVVYDLKSEKR
ncbi:hypothetical protein BGZ96_003705 [Linnemannia gamsii]|uniref:F-box domain-containing protein n=1 Tax=Linnemannia gamsii TaxID=64522 RepID=A0ABQ7K966_9FUNG|nr:hypothetical protein BGZ96_003705 [Linnemannia gamsii]